MTELGSNGLEKTRRDYIKDIESGMPAPQILKKWGKKPYWFLFQTDFQCPPAAKFRADYTDASGVDYQWLSSEPGKEVFGFNIRRIKREQREGVRERFQLGSKITIAGRHYTVYALKTKPIERPATGLLIVSHQ